MMTRKTKLIVMLSLSVIGTPIIIVSAIRLAMSGLKYGLIYPLGVVSAFFLLTVFFWTITVPEGAFVFLKTERPKDGHARAYKGYIPILLTAMIFSVGLMMIGFTLEAWGGQGARVTLYSVICLGNMFSAFWLVWYCTCRSGWALQMAYSSGGMCCRYGSGNYELAELKYLEDNRDKWIADVRVGGLWRSAGVSGDLAGSLKTFEFRVSRTLYPRIDLNHFIATMKDLSSRTGKTHQSGQN